MLRKRIREKNRINEREKRESLQRIPAAKKKEPIPNKIREPIPEDKTGHGGNSEQKDDVPASEQPASKAIERI
jgi:hypothetical protein